MERNQRSTFQGVVVSTKMNKTIVVEIETHKKHAKYGKRVKYGKRYYAHDEESVAREGDTVTIRGTRPISKLKRFVLVSVDKKAQMSIKAAEAELKLEEAEGSAAEVAEAKEEKVEETPVEESKGE